MVEFALVLLPLLVLVGGVIQLGIGIATWHDLNRVANEGARYAATDEWPGCPPAQATCAGNPACNAAPAALNGRSLANFLGCEARLPSSSVVICTPGGASAGLGLPVTVRLTSRFNFLSLDQTTLTKVSWLRTTIRGEATMRVERPPTKYSAASC
jgi:hypothetical protein